MLPIRDTISSRNLPIATWLLIVANSAVFLLEVMVPPPALDALIHLFGIVPARYTHPEWAVWAGYPVDHFWPFFTSMFLHGDWLHLLGNMWTLWIFGDNVEDRMGPVRFVAFYLICGLAAGLVHWFTNLDSTIPTLGASGAIAGVMGAYFFLFPHSRLIVLVPILFFPWFFEMPAVAFLGFWALTQVVSGVFSPADSLLVGGVAWWAHVGGFFVGMALQFIFVRDERPLSRDEYGLERAWLPADYWRTYR
jgi:membrane associated rhomboid family serine protease